ncbi:chorismate mutase [Clostridium akagii]|uniref:chorismate mutase n=1 Tax=Clostridium akagii TaxID=91623 RepID=UPI00047C3C3F|nr:chorismate mutase [Clostridium akagii]
MKDLKTLRNEIDVIDKEIVALYEKRMDAVLGVAAYKNKNSVPILNSSRENEVIERNLNLLKNKDYLIPTEKLLKTIMDISRDYQSSKIFALAEKRDKSSIMDLEYELKKDDDEKKYSVGFQGVPGSFSEEALIQYFGSNTISRSFSEFQDVFEALQNGKIDYGVLPVENSSTGGITEVYELLRKYGLYITGEKCIKVSHNLLGIKGAKLEDITEVYSHPQAFQQSNVFFKNYPNLNLVPYYNTATSAELVSKKNSNTIAAVASEKAADLYNLDILEKNINYNTQNYTRFIVISKNVEVSENCNKISVVITVPHKTGSLYNILSNFAHNNLNMMKIESRPIEGKPWEYFFYIDFQGNLINPEIKKAVALIERNSSYFKLLGNYTCTT